MIFHVSTEVLTIRLVKPSGNLNSNSSGIDPVVVNKLIIDISIQFCIYARRVFRLQKTHQCRSDPKKVKKDK